MPVWIRRTLEILALAAVYFVLARLGLMMDAVSGFATLVWPPTGISLAVLLLFGYRLWPGVLLGAFLANASIGAPPLAALSIGTGNMLEAVLAAYLLHRIGFRNSFDRLRDVFAFVTLGVLLSTMVSASIGVASLSVAGLVPAPRLTYTWLAWWIGDIIGGLVVSPLILAWFRPRLATGASARMVEGAFLLVTLIGMAAFNFGDWPDPGLTKYIRPYCIFPVLIWAALRFEQRGAVTSTFVLSIIAVWLTASGSGPFRSDTLSDRLISLQLFMGVVAVTTLALAAASAERNQAIESLRSIREQLEERVRARTQELTGVNRMLSEAQEQAHIGSWAWDIPGDTVTWSDELFDIFGQDPAAFEGTYGGFLACVHPEDRERIKGRIRESLKTGKPFAFDHRIIRPDSTVRVVHGEGKVSMSPAGTAVRMAGTAQDITDRIRAETEIRKLNEGLERRVRERTAELETANEALAHENRERIRTEDTLFQSRELFRNLVENISEIYYICDGRGRLVYGSPNLYARSGYTEAELVGRSYVRLIMQDDRRRVTEYYLARTADGTIDTTCEFRVLLKDRSTVWVEQSTRFIRNQDGSVAEYRNVVRDVSRRKEAEEKLHETQHLIQAIIDNSTAVIYVKDTRGRYLLINRRFEQLFHVSKVSILGKIDHDIFPPPMAHQFRANDLEVLRMRAPLEREEVAPHDDGPHTYISLKVPLYDDSGTAFGICGISTDITDRKSAEEDVGRSRERYRGFFENSPISLWEEDFSEVKRHIEALRESGVLDFRKFFEAHHDVVAQYAAKVRVLDVNKATLRLYEAGSKSDFFMGLSRVLSRESYDVFREELIAVAEGKPEFESEDVNTTLLGRGINIHLKWSVGPGNEETYSRVLVSIIDITEQKSIEKQKRLLAQALESTTEMICITNLQDRIIFANKAFLGTYGYSEQEILGADPAILRSPRNPAGITDQIFEHSRTRGWAGELLNSKKDGTEFPIYLSTSPIRDSGGNVLGLIGVARDISDITNAEKVLWEAASRIEKLFEAAPEQTRLPVKQYEPYDTDPAKRKHDLARDISEVVGMLRTRAQQTLSFSSLASHQLRTPLTILRSQLENALRPDLSAASLRRTLSSTYDEILHLSHVVDVLLNLSRMQAGTVRLDVQDIDFYDLLKEFYRESLLLAREKKISVVLRNGPRATIQADPEQLRQVLLNLLDNAIKYTPLRGRICLSYTVGENELVFEFGNSGKGIAPGILSSMFDPFRSGETGGEIKKGTGLGLALVKWIVESHRGTVEARSIPDEGTTFVIRLPIRALS